MNDENEVPPAADPRWEGWCKPLFGFLHERPRTWADLNAWRRKERVTAALMQNMLSWLSVRHMADWDGHVWRSIGETERQLILEAEEATERILREELPSSRPGPGQFFITGSRAGVARSDRDG
jgi:hypothetical protein